ncbi:MAG TPA: PDZ domain-containing protein, partial [Elusimicrobiales bacterium]|nr:PDZ domain-containing protein [Elusimicrobiales bacterium]
MLTAFERHSYEAHSSREVLAALKAGPAALKALDPRLELLKTEKPLREMPGGGLSSGLLLGERAGALYVVKVFRGSPAEAAGVMEGDRVLEVDGQRLDPASAAARIRGALDFRVKVGRAGAGGRLTASEAGIKKRLIVLPLIFGLHDPASRTVFVRAAIFSKGSGAAVAEGLAALARQGLDRVVFDLR